MSLRTTAASSLRGDRWPLSSATGINPTEGPRRSPLLKSLRFEGFAPECFRFSHVFPRLFHESEALVHQPWITRVQPLHDRIDPTKKRLHARIVSLRTSPRSGGVLMSSGSITSGALQFDSFVRGASRRNEATLFLPEPEPRSR
jgi:hypothetical protein